MIFLQLFHLLSSLFLHRLYKWHMSCNQIAPNNIKLSFSFRLGLNLYWMRFRFTNLDENIFAPDGCTGSICHLSVRLCPSLHHSVEWNKDEESFLLPRGLSHTNSQPANFHDFWMKPLMVTMLCTTANENEVLLITLLMFCCDYSLTHLFIEAKNSFKPCLLQVKDKQGF